LVVIVGVIPILVVLAIMGIGSWRTKVANTEVRNDIFGLQASMEDVRNRTGSYPTFAPNTTFDSSSGASSIFIQSENVEITYEAGDATYYCINFQSTEVDDVSMFLDTTDGNTVAQSGSC
jgi:hypothetical protein